MGSFRRVVEWSIEGYHAGREVPDEWWAEARLYQAERRRNNKSKSVPNAAAAAQTRRRAEVMSDMGTGGGDIAVVVVVSGVVTDKIVEADGGSGSVEWSGVECCSYQDSVGRLTSDTPSQQQQPASQPVQRGRLLGLLLCQDHLYNNNRPRERATVITVLLLPSASLKTFNVTAYYPASQYYSIVTIGPSMRLLLRGLLLSLSISLAITVQCPRLFRDMPVESRVTSNDDASTSTMARVH